MVLASERVTTPIGDVAMVFDEERLCALDFVDCESRMIALLMRRYGEVELKTVQHAGAVSARLSAYFNGHLNALNQVPVSTAGTPFQERVWGALRSIEVGSTLSYGALAVQLGNPRASRAVGLANSLNPIAIVIPCHRVVGTDQSLTGYAGGLDRKRWLLRHEGAALL